MLQQAGMSQRELARRLGYHPNTVNRWQRAPRPVLAYLKLYIAARQGIRYALARVEEE